MSKINKTNILLSSPEKIKDQSKNSILAILLYIDFPPIGINEIPKHNNDDHYFLNLVVICNKEDLLSDLYENKTEKHMWDIIETVKQHISKELRNDHVEKLVDILTKNQITMKLGDYIIPLNIEHNENSKTERMTPGLQELTIAKAVMDPVNLRLRGKVEINGSTIDKNMDVDPLLKEYMIDYRKIKINADGIVSNDVNKSQTISLSPIYGKKYIENIRNLSTEYSEKYKKEYPDL
jgi:hypothetical protein